MVFIKKNHGSQDNWRCDFSPAPGIAWIQAGAHIPTGLVSVKPKSMEAVPERKLSVFEGDDAYLVERQHIGILVKTFSGFQFILEWGTPTSNGFS